MKYCIFWKRYLFLLLSLFVVLEIEGQEYIRLLTSGRVWNLEFVHPFSGSISYTLSVDGDTLVNDIVCKKLKREIGSETEPFIIACEIDRKIYHIEQDGTMILMLDFSKHLGDTVITLDDELKLYVMQEDSIKVRGRKYRRIIVGNPDSEQSVCWVEGIGSNCDVWATLSAKPMGSIIYMKECYENEELIFCQSDFNTISSVGLISPNNEEELSLKFFSINGMSLTKLTQSGFYILKGKKKYKK